jgi:AraC-like DNA-binding protein
VGSLSTTSLLLFSLKKMCNRQANGALGLFLILLGASYVSDILYENHFFEWMPHLYDYDGFLTLLLGPLLYFYILLQTRPDFSFRPVHLLHLSSLVLYLLIQWDFFTSDASAKVAFIKDDNRMHIPNQFLAHYYKIGQVLLYEIMCYCLLARHRRTVKELLSSVENRQLQWLRNLLLASAGLFLIWVLCNQIAFSYNFQTPVYLSVVALLFFTYWIAYYAVTQEYVFEGISTVTVMPIIRDEARVRYRNSTLTEDDIKRLMLQTEQHMRQSKPYLDSNLTLITLADQLQFNPKHLSQILNEGFGGNFYKYVNGYRVEESKHLLRDSLHKYNILGVAYQAGFKSKSTFNKAFREFTGCSPSEFAKDV